MTIWVGIDETLLPRSQLRAAWLLLWLNALDLVLTYTAIHHGAVEGNPLAVWLIASYVAIPAKLGLAGFAIWATKKWPARVTLRTVTAAWWAVGVYSLVVVLNTITLISYL